MTKAEEDIAPENRADDDNAATPGRLRKHSMMIAGHRTSISLEDVFWSALERVARRRGESITSLVTAIDARRTGNLSSAIRVHVLAELEVRLRTLEKFVENSRSQR